MSSFFLADVESPQSKSEVLAFLKKSTFYTIAIRKSAEQHNYETLIKTSRRLAALAGGLGFPIIKELATMLMSEATERKPSLELFESIEALEEILAAMRNIAPESWLPIDDGKNSVLKRQIIRDREDNYRRRQLVESGDSRPDSLDTRL